MKDLRLILNVLFMGICSLFVLPAVAQDDAPAGPILFTNVNVFDGVSEKLIRIAIVGIDNSEGKKCSREF